MTEHQKADQARKGLIDTVKGKAKEIAGAVTNNDSLTAEGQLEQAQAQQRKEANALDAVADAEAADAREQKIDAQVEAAQERAGVRAQTAATEDAVRAQEAEQKSQAERAATQQKAAEAARADQEAGSAAAQAKAREQAQQREATEQVVEAAQEYDERTLAAETDRAAAKSLRQQADAMTDDH
ncbi:hypothetical protein MMUR_27820 [Mycolicibacterium murale]|uniref:CsbD family protein n=1 Tax=Mycolicibacterium murale TaxID=182220 RepID=A0A7I9WMZ3_9MYCO|nr:CsbD family protein [Mycolicibacterium murale]MCV7181241.1 CsbD family protein [Mycolicibacterium murale]GFG58646.1 hypothetical protein MMUR_27820 [Mycolicibacterium murale]